MARAGGCARHCVCLLSFVTWLIGGAILGTMMWVLATAPTVKIFFNGTLVFTYVVLCIGSLLFVNGILGWIGSYKRGTCLMKLYLLLSVLTISSEVGGIVALNVMKMKMSDVLHKAWFEVNQITRNVVQQHFDCCGFLGPEEFIENTEPIDNSCYYNVSAEGEFVNHVRSLNRMGCKEKMVDWFYNNKFMWIASLGALLLLQVTVVLFVVYVINQTKRARRSPSSSSYNDIHYHTRL